LEVYNTGLKAKTKMISVVSFRKTLTFGKGKGKS